MIDIINNLSGIKGVIGVSVLNKNNEIIPEKEISFPQVYTDYGYKAFFTSDGSANFANATGGIIGFCRVGKGGVERAVTDVGLHTVIAGTAVASTTSGDYSCESVTIDGKHFVKFNKKYPFALGQIVDTITEVGIFSISNTNNTMVAGQLIKDAGGIPTPITVLVDEQLIVSYSVYVECPRKTASPSSAVGYSDSNNGVFTSGSIVVNGTTHDYTLAFSGACYGQPYALTVSNFYIMFNGSLTTVAKGTAVRLNGNTVNDVIKNFWSKTGTAYANRVERFYTLEMTPSAGAVNITRLGLAAYEGNGGEANGYEFVFTPPIPKSALESFYLSVKITNKWRDL